MENKIEFQWSYIYNLLQMLISKYGTLQPESQSFIDQCLAKPQSQLNLGFKNKKLG